MSTYKMTVKPSGKTHRRSSIDRCFHLYGTLGLGPRFRVFLMLALWLTCVSARGDELPGDFNDNGSVDFVDFSLLLEAFGSVDPRFDLNGSGRVDFEDLFLFADRFGDGTALERARHDSVFAARLDSML